MSSPVVEQRTTLKAETGEIFAAEVPQGKYLVDPYEDWMQAEGLPVLTGASIDLLAAPTQPWARFGCKGAFVRLDGRDDFLGLALVELLPHSRSAPQRHLYEELCYVLAGQGATEIEHEDGSLRVLEWRERSVFAIPMNARYRHRNDGAQPARFAAVSDLRYLLGLYRNESFIFDTAMDFSERTGVAEVIDAGVHASGPAGAPATASIAADLVDLAPRTYDDASRQFQGTYSFGVAGEGYTLSFPDAAGDWTRMEWRHGIVCAAAGMRFAQHFNPGAGPARRLEVQYGSRRFPLLRARRAAYGDASVYAAGHATIARVDEHPRIAEDFDARRQPR